MKVRTITNPLAAVAAILLTATLTSCTYDTSGPPPRPNVPVPWSHLPVQPEQTHLPSDGRSGRQERDRLLALLPPGSGTPHRRQSSRRTRSRCFPQHWPSPLPKTLILTRPGQIPPKPL